MKRILSTAGWLVMAAALTVATLTACSSSDEIITDEPQQPEEPATGKYTMTIEASKGGDATTRALSLEGTTLNATWKKGEKVVVLGANVAGDDVEEIGTLTAQADGATTTLTGTIDKTPNAGRPIFLSFPKYPCVYTGQKGTLADISANFDYASSYIARDKWSATNNQITTTSTAEFSNEQAVVRFTLKDKSGNLLNASSLTIHDERGYLVQSGELLTGSAGDVIVTPEDPTSEIWAALNSQNASMNLTLTATVGDNTYTYSKSDVKFKIGEFYDITVKMQPSTPLTMEATTAGTIVVNNPKSGMQYSLDGGTTKTAMTETTTIENLKAGDKVQFYGNGTSITKYFGTYIAGGTADVKVYGNIMSLVDETGYATNTTVPATQAFGVLFFGNAHLKDASGLRLPAMTLTTQCYNGMFGKCTGLTTAPETLPAMTMVDRCYQSMFQGCTSLTTAPTLPATTLVAGCYGSMFQDCSNLNSVTCLATDISASNCTRDWLTDAGTNATAPMLYVDPSMTGASWNNGNFTVTAIQQ